MRRASQAGVTTGSALVCEAQMSPVRKTHRDAAIEEENRTIDRKVNSTCCGR